MVLLSATIRRHLQTIIQWLKSIDFVRTLRMNLKNTREFSDLYEHEKMLADEVRVESYRRAIQRHVKSGEVVVDLGTGTGILSFFAARQAPSRIYAIDHSDFIEVAEKIAEQNDIDNITFIKANSRTFDPEEKVDVIIHEQIGDHLFDENMITNILDLKHRLLKKSGLILPGRFQVYLEPVSLNEEYRVPFLWEHNIAGIDFSFLKDSEVTDRFQSSDHELEWLETAALEAFLCEPSPILTFDLNKMEDENELPRTLTTTKRVVHTGTMDGLCFYFRVIFDEKIAFDTSPVNTNTHWGNRLFRTKRREISAGETISWRLTMNDLLDVRSWSVSVSTD